MNVSNGAREAMATLAPCHGRNPAEVVAVVAVADVFAGRLALCFRPEGALLLNA